MTFDKKWPPDPPVKPAAMIQSLPQKPRRDWRDIAWNIVWGITHIVWAAFLVYWFYQLYQFHQFTEAWRHDIEISRQNNRH